MGHAPIIAEILQLAGAGGVSAGEEWHRDRLLKHSWIMVPSCAICSIFLAALLALSGALLKENPFRSNDRLDPTLESHAQAPSAKAELPAASPGQTSAVLRIRPMIH
jgi:hypothetical protein